MNEQSLQKEKLLTMLTEIYDRLEELESGLHSSLEDLRDDWNEKQAARLTSCGSRLSALETKMKLMNGKEDPDQADQRLELELGY
ncbi:hypothetical protein CU633_11550 [Bacillus sp. V3-13]|uniref:hypothetical protein n=1 Tax=Bacillus sp. V3-13 TaxID=2053728 RepID=UPI000C78B5B8|nr:hypothetical protein [Bacillus sp. V3-13]PLR77177.1 hypothetical protein CU633_11550 [Bacillus sp. V3-13]